MRSPKFAHPFTREGGDVDDRLRALGAGRKFGLGDLRELAQGRGCRRRVEPRIGHGSVLRQRQLDRGQALVESRQDLVEDIERLAGEEVVLARQNQI